MYKTRDEKIKETVEALKIALPIETVLEQLDTKKTAGAYFCPLVPHHKASFRVTKTGTGFQCFHCGAKGTVISLLTELRERNLIQLPASNNFESTLLAIGEEFNIPLPYRDFSTSVDKDVPLITQISDIFSKTRHRHASPTVSTTEMIYNSNLFKLKNGTVSIEEFVATVASLQDPQDTVASALIQSIKTMEDLFADDEDGDWEGGIQF